MPNMILGGTTFDYNPSEMECLIPQRFNNHVLTYSGVEFFSWGASIVGKTIELRWNYMPSDQFADLNTLYQADTQIVWNPQLGDSKTYNVEIINLTGSYFLELENTGVIHRKNVILALLIISEV